MNWPVGNVSRQLNDKALAYLSWDRAGQERRQTCCKGGCQARQQSCMPNRWPGSGQVHGVGGFCAIGAHSSGRGLDDSDYGYGPLSFSVACPNYAEPYKNKTLWTPVKVRQYLGTTRKPTQTCFGAVQQKKNCTAGKKIAVQFFVLIGKYR